MELWEAAWEEWGQNGVPVFPASRDKRPLCKWRTEASTDEGRIHQLFRDAGDSAQFIGAAMGEQAGLFALDFDTYKEQEAQQYREVLQTADLLPPTRVHKTKSGGLHYLYAVRRENEVPRISVPANGVEIRGEGGYIIVPPSPGYEVLHAVSPVEAPEQLLNRLIRSRRAFNESSVEQLRKKIVEGEAFHEALTMIAAKMHGRGESSSKVLDYLLEAMGSSVAKNPEHHRHGRWLHIMRGKDNELARISESAFQKFNPSRNQDVTVDKMTRPVDAAGGLFRDSVAGTVDTNDSTPSNALGDGSTRHIFPFDKSYQVGDSSSDSDKQYLLYPLIMEGDTIVLSAAPKAGKTLVTTTMCLHMASGIPLGDMQPLDSEGNLARVSIIYFALEGQSVIRKRIKAWMLHHGVTDYPDMYVVELPTNLLDPEQRQSVVDKLLLANKYFESIGWGDLGFIVFDTLTKAMPGGDQNSVEDTSAVFQTIDLIREVGIEASVLFVHHDNRQGKGPRGSGNIQAEPDTLLTVAKSDQIIKDGNTYDSYDLSVFMARAIDDTQEYKYAAIPVDIGKNRQGIMEHAPVLEAIDRYEPIQTKEQHTLQEKTAIANEAFFAFLTEILIRHENKMLLRAVHKAMRQKGGAVSAYYAAFLNGNEKDQVKTSWRVLLSPPHVPDDGREFKLEGDSVSLELHL